MKKFSTLIIISILVILSCEKDDICLEETTPNMIIKFYDFENKTDVKAVSGLTVWADTKEDYFSGNVDSIITIPLDLNNDFTLYKMTTGTFKDSINFVYNRNDIFVSRSCGYKTIYEEMEIESASDSWIKEIEVINTTIDNDTIAQIHIFH